MKNYLIIILFAVVTLNSCKNSCSQKICTDNSVSIVVKFLNQNGNPIVVKDFKSIISRTQKDISNISYLDTVYFKGIYQVATDGNLGDIKNSEKILVSAINPKTNQLKEVEFVVSGGDCACHISKISGPEIIQFE